MTQTDTHPADKQTHTVTIHVNEKPVKMPSRTATGLEIKQTAIEQGVRIELDFVLVEEIGPHRKKTIGDRDVVKLDDKSRFIANDGDENS